MATARIQFREDEESVSWLKERGINPNELARDLLEAEICRLRAKEWAEKIKAMKINLPRPAALIIREERESH